MENKNIAETEDRGYRSAILAAIRGNNTDEELREILADYHDNDIASVLEELEQEERDRLLRAVGSEAMSDIIAYLDDAGEILSEFDADDAADIIEQMDADEALEALDDLDEEARSEVFELIEDEAKEDIQLLDSYNDDEFGSVMSTNFISIQRGMSVKGAMRAMIAEAPENDNIYTLFVTEDDGKFYGIIDLKELIIARKETPLDDLISTKFPYIYDNDIISDNIERVRGYSEDLIPVLDHNTFKLLGVITAKDITEIVDAERGDDYAKLAALSSEEDAHESVFKSMRKRIPWLVALLFLGLVVSVVVGMFGNVIKELVLVVCFQSLILDMAGNAGTQSLAVTVRSLGSDDSSVKGRFGFIFKETRVALMNGLILGTCSFLLIGLYLMVLKNPVAVSFATSGCVGIALCVAMMIAGFTGSSIPTLLNKIGVDPAVASGPLITTINDLIAVVTYYGLAWLFLLKLGIGTAL